MAGNSWLTQCQWFIGAEKPPHLTCLCPYEGWNDMYNDTTNRGGIPDPGFQAGLLFKACPGLGKTEDVATMAKEHTMWNEYYESRKAKVENINVPMYIVASWTNFLHTRGTFRGYLESYACEKKWLRVHNSHEWPGE
jgi:predicted acyl esterase